MARSVQAARRLEVAWEDPFASAAAGLALPGIEYIRAVAAGDIPRPPIAALLGMEIVEAEEGRALFAVTPAEHHYNPIGVVHGGVAATLLDSAMGCAVHTTLAAGGAMARSTSRRGSSARSRPTQGGS